VRAELTGAQATGADYITSCWSLIETDDAVKVTGRYEPKGGKIATVESFVSKAGESAQVRRQTGVENMQWYEEITADIFS